MKKTSLLVIEDEEAIRDMLRFSLPAVEFELTDAGTVAQAVRLLADQIPNLILLDWMLPDKSGIDFIKWIKTKESLKDIPIIMLTAKVEEAQKIQGLAAGADDYVTKPGSTAELAARIKAVLRRGLVVSPNDNIVVGELNLNTAQHKVCVRGNLVTLTPLEYKFLYFFLTHPDKIYTRDQLITHIWGGNVYIDDRTADVQIKRLRAKLKPHRYHEIIKTVRGAGYIYEKKI